MLHFTRSGRDTSADPSGYARRRHASRLTWLGVDLKMFEASRAYKSIGIVVFLLISAGSASMLGALADV